MITTQLDVFLNREWITVHTVEDVVVSAPEPLRFMDAKRFTLQQAKDWATRKNYIWFCKPPRYQEVGCMSHSEFYRGYS